MRFPNARRQAFDDLKRRYLAEANAYKRKKANGHAAEPSSQWRIKQCHGFGLVSHAGARFVGVTAWRACVRRVSTGGC